MVSFSIIVPIYNESENIKDLILEIFNSLNQSNEYELIIIDDGSNDNTNEIINTIDKKYSFQFLKHKKNLGQSYSIQTGIKNSKFDTIVTLDGDGQNDPNDIPFPSSQSLCNTLILPQKVFVLFTEFKNFLPSLLPQS